MLFFYIHAYIVLHGMVPSSSMVERPNQHTVGNYRLFGD